MKKILAFAIALCPLSMCHASMTCAAAYATDQQIVNHGPVETKLGSVKLDLPQAIPGTNREVSINQIGKGLLVSLSANGSLLASAKLSQYTSGTEVSLDVPNAQYDEYVRISCK